MTTDIHTHLGTSHNEVNDVNFDTLNEEVDMLISRMDVFGVERAVLTPNVPWISNELYLKATEIYPDRLYTACSIIPRPIDIAKAQLREYIDDGCVALILSDETFHPSDPAAQSIVNYAVKENLPIYFQIQNMTSDTITFFDAISSVYNDGKFVILSMGGLFGFPQIIPLVSRKNMWIELSTTFIKLVESPLRVFLDALVQDIGIRKLVFGSGYHTQYVDMTAALNMIDMNVETRRLVLSENAWLILGLQF